MNAAMNDILDVAGIFDETLEKSVGDALQKLPSIFMQTIPKTPSGGSVTMSPGIAVRLISLLSPKKDAAFLVVGVENGFSLGLLSLLGVRTFSVEADGIKAQRVRKLLDSIPGLSTSLTLVAPTENGWSEYQPYDGILILGVPQKISKSIFSQVSSDRGKIACLVGDEFSQTVTVWEKNGASVKKVSFEVVQGYA